MQQLNESDTAASIAMLACFALVAFVLALFAT